VKQLYFLRIYLYVFHKNKFVIKYVTKNSKTGQTTTALRSISEEEYNNAKKSYNKSASVVEADYNRRVAAEEARYNISYNAWMESEATKKLAYDALVNEETTKLSYKQLTDTDYVFNTAYNYLKLNGKILLAPKLRSFIELLSNISIESPWYFTNVSGISNALTKKYLDNRKPEFSERKHLTITCLPDAFDNRIGTLLDLYRSVSFDWINKQELIPANLRKFDMAIYIFEAPDQTWHKEDIKDIKKLGEQWINAFDSSIASALRLNQLKDDATKQHASFDLLSEGFHPSFKLIEFHDCEFNYNNSATAWSKMDNQLGTAPIYTIDISYGDCYEISYNDLMHTVIGDVDTIGTTTYYETQYDYVKKRIDPEEKSWFKKLGTGLLQRANNKALGMVKNMAYGNLYGFSLTDTLREIKNGIDNPMAAFDTIKKYVTDGKEIFNESVKQTKSISNVFKDNVHNSIGLNTFKAEYNSNNKNLGSIFKSTSIANNL
jgi:hypothetical protein